MPDLTAFVQTSLDGFFADEKGSVDWAHKAPDDTEWQEFVAGNAKQGGRLLFGRITYQMMASWWPTPKAMEMMPEVAREMNRMPKVVFSRTLTKVDWENTTLLKGDLATEVKRLKADDGPDMAILGSGTIISQLVQVGLIDELMLAVNPLILGRGKPLFTKIDGHVPLTLVGTREFRNGTVLQRYAPTR